LSGRLGVESPANNGREDANEPEYASHLPIMRR
jgi:hypothetical protein